MANASSICYVANIIRSDKARKCIVLSAPGLRDTADTKITDLLYMSYNNPIVWKIVGERLQTIVDDLQVEFDLSDELDSVFCDIANGGNQDYVVSRGEYIISKIVSKLIGYTFVDAKDIIMVDQEGKIDLVQTRRQAKKLISPYIGTGVVVPGFYGAYNNSIRLLGRGGSDITGAALSYALASSEYENWTDVDGMSVFDPHIGHSQYNSTMSYHAAITLAQAGANVIHPDSCAIAALDNIPITIKNTFNPNANGTRIVANCCKQSKVLGVGSVSNLRTIVLSKLSLSSDTVLQDVLKLIVKYNIDTININADNNSIVLTIDPRVEATQSNQRNNISRFRRVLTSQLNPISCKVHNTALIKIVGKDILSQALQTLSLYRAKVLSSAQSKDVSTIVVSSKDYEMVMDMLYRQFGDDGYMIVK